MLSGTTLDSMVDPQVGLVFGYGWAADVGEFLRDQPRAELTRDEAEIQEWSLTSEITFCDVPVSIHFLFSLDALVTVELRLLAELLDPPTMEKLAWAVAGWFNEELTTPDEGILEVEELTTRMTFDVLDKRIVLEDLEL